MRSLFLKECFKGRRIQQSQLRMLQGRAVPLTICLCLLSQLLGASFRRSTTWLLCTRLERSYHAVAMRAFSRCRFLMTWSLWAWKVHSR